jgi:hypothetical protein
MSSDDVLTPLPHQEEDILIEQQPPAAVDDAQPPSPTPSMAKSVGAASLGRRPTRKKVRPLSAVSDVSFASTLERRGDVFVAPFAAGPLAVITPTITIKTEISDEDEDLEYVDLRLKTSACDLMRRLEEDLLQKAKHSKDEWFQNPDMDDAFLDHSFKRFVDEGRVITVRLDDALEVPDGCVTKGTKAKVVLECEGAVFTRTQFGVLWTLKMIKAIDKNEYLFDPEETVGLAAGDILAAGAGEPVG